MAPHANDHPEGGFMLPMALGQWCETWTQKELCIMLKLAMQDDTPKPTSEDVYIHSTPSATFYVSQYGGYSMDDITVSKHVCSPSPGPLVDSQCNCMMWPFCSRRQQCLSHTALQGILGYLLQANDLISKLKEDGMDFEEDFYFTAGYDAPFK